MFTGIIEEVAEVVAIERRGDSAVLRVRAVTAAEGVSHGASIAVNGVCLTVVGQTPADGGSVDLDFDVMAETLKRSVIGSLETGERVNLERAARVDSRLDGHIVQGHVDGTGVVLARTPGDEWESFRFGMPTDLARYVTEKGSIAVHGVSLTVTAVSEHRSDEGARSGANGGAVGDDWFEVGLIPETLRATNLGARAVGDPVNLEVDVLAKYTERLLAHSALINKNGGA
jgi:riboflavin synthase